MIEKVVTLDNISLVDFLGVENKTIDSLAAAFPKSKIVSRGNQIVIKGSTSELVQIDDILNALIEHYHKYGRITEENVQNYITREQEIMLPDSSASSTSDEVIDLVEGGAGVRAQACDRNGGLVDDFMIVEEAKVINVCNAPSPAATSSLSIGETVAGLALKRL